jgi:SAM-dependent methyltransferase
MRIELTPYFAKYGKRGAYHWEHLSKFPWKHNCYTASRYSLVLEASQIRPGEQVLDLGCGDGALTYLLHLQGAICTGIEPDETGRALAEAMFHKKGGQAKYLGDLADVSSDSQDVVICSEVIEHVEDSENLLRDAKRVIKPGGRIIISTPIRMTEFPLDREHVREFFPQEFKVMVERQFKVIDHLLELPAFAVMMYYWRPWFFLHQPVIKIVMNLLSAWGGVYVMKGCNSLNRYHTLQIIVAKRAS